MNNARMYETVHQSETVKMSFATGVSKQYDLRAEKTSKVLLDDPVRRILLFHILIKFLAIG